MKFPRSGLYAITQTEDKSFEQVLTEVAAAIRGGAVVIQYRDKHPIDAPYLAGELLKLCRSQNVPLLINDDVELAASINVDGVHLGRDDGAVTAARQRLGDAAIIGVSCYDDVERAVMAEREGADYVAFGRFFPSTSKPLASPARLETLKEAKNRLSLPVVAIGGILPENGGQLLEAGAGLLAVIGGVFSGDVESSARAYQSLFVDD